MTDLGLFLAVIFGMGATLIYWDRSMDDDEVEDTSVPEPEPDTPEPTIYDDDDSFGDDGAILGTEGDDILSGGVRADGIGAENTDTTTPNDFMRGEGGDDVLLGGIGFDQLDGSPGNDTLSGGAGADLVIDNQGDDILRGDDGDDYLLDFAVADSDTFEGGRGDDTLVSSTPVVGDAPHTATMTGGPGDDYFGTDQGPNGRQVITDWDTDNTGDFNPLNNDYISLYRTGTSLAEVKAAAQAAADAGQPDTEIDLGAFGTYVFEGINDPDAFTEDNTGLSETATRAEASADFIFFTDNSVAIVAKPVVGAPVVAEQVTWGDGTFAAFNPDNEPIATKSFDDPGVYTVRYAVETSAGRIGFVYYRVDTINRTVTETLRDGGPVEGFGGL
jgi:hypothetical protein